MPLLLGLGLLRQAINRLANAFTRLAESVEEVNAGLRSQAHLDGDPAELPPVVAARHAGLPAGEPEGEGEGNGELPVSTGGKKGRKS